MTLLVTVLLLGALVFVLGLLIGQECNRRALNDRRRRVVALRRERDDLARLLARLDEHRRPR